MKCFPSEFHGLLLSLVFFTTQHSCWTSLHKILGFLGPFYSLGILGPLYSLGILGPFRTFLPFFTFPWVFAKSFGFLWPNCHILFLWVYYPSNQSHLPILFSGLLQHVFCFLSISHDSHGLATSFFGASLAHLLSLKLLCYFAGSWTIIPAIQAQ